MIVQSQLIHETKVRRHLNDWLNGEKLAPANGGSDSHLSEEKTAELVTYLTNNLLPTTQAIIKQVIDWWGIRYTVPGMTKWLHRNGFSYRKPVGIPHKFSAEAQKIFVETYNELKQKKPVTMNLSCSSMAFTRHREQNLHMAGYLQKKKLSQWKLPVVVPGSCIQHVDIGV